MKIDAVTAVALFVVIASFAIDRIVSAFLFLLRFARIIPDPAFLKPEPKRKRAEQVNTLVYTLLAGVLGVVVLAYFGDIRLLHAIGFQQINPKLDMIVTGLLLMGGAEQIGKILDLHGTRASEKDESRPIEVTGTLKLESETASKIMGQAG